MEINTQYQFMLPEELLAELDEAAKAGYMSRSEYIRQILHREVVRLQAEPHYKPPQLEFWKKLDTDDS